MRYCTLDKVETTFLLSQRVLTMRVASLFVASAAAFSPKSLPVTARRAPTRKTTVYKSTGLGGCRALRETFVSLDAIEQTQSWKKSRVAGAGRLSFDSHTGETARMVIG